MPPSRSRPSLSRRFAAFLAGALLVGLWPVAMIPPLAATPNSGGPLIVGGPTLGISGVPFTWDPATMPIQYRVDPGPMAVAPSGNEVISNAAGIAVGTFDLTVQVSDPGPPAQTSDPVTLQLIVAGNLGRNNSPATATMLSNGTYQASISPVADPPTGVVNPDSDYYVLTANPGTTVTIEIMAQRLSPFSPLNSVIEIVDAGNNRLSICSRFPAIGSFDRACVNDDLQQGISTDSKLNMKVPDADPGPLTFYVHVLDWRGDARPDLLYTITISGAN